MRSFVAPRQRLSHDSAFSFTRHSTTTRFDVILAASNGTMHHERAANQKQDIILRND